MGSVLAPVALLATYAGAGESVWIIAAGLAILAVITFAYSFADDPDRALVTSIMLGTLFPALIGWSLATPLIGAILLVTATLTNRSWRSRITVRPTVNVVVGSLVVIAGVIAFQAVSTLARSSSAVNATFEELLWRTALPDLFRSRRWLAAQWLLLSACFGASHLHGTPGGIVGMGFATIFGFTMCVIRELSRGSVVWIIGVHFVADVIVIGGLYGVYPR